MPITKYIKAVVQRPFQKLLRQWPWQGLSSRNSLLYVLLGFSLRQWRLSGLIDWRVITWGVLRQCCSPVRVRRQDSSVTVLYSSQTFAISGSLSVTLCLSVCLNVSLSLTHTHSLSCFQHFGNEFRNKQTHKIYYITYLSLLMKQIMTFSRFIRLAKNSFFCLFCTFCVFCSICLVVFLARKLFWLAT